LQRLFGFFGKVDRTFAAIIRALLIVVILGMVVFVTLQIILRNFFNSGIPWAEVAARNAVMWIAFLGAMLATRSRQHISIDVLMKMIPRRARNFVRIGLDLMACVISFLLALASLDFVMEEYSMGNEIFIGIKAWMTQVIIPFGFAMISVEYAIGIGLDIYRLAKDSSHVAGRGRE
jgi:TRAP-type C4-dicarboxylate transport system permease small subunit